MDYLMEKEINNCLFILPKNEDERKLIEEYLNSFKEIKDETREV